MGKRLVRGEILYTDSTHLKVNANKNKWQPAFATQERKAYMDSLDEAVTQDRLSHGKKPLAHKIREPKQSPIKQSTTDPDSGYMVRDNKPKGFFYLDHRSVDSQCNIITDVHVTAGNVHDSIPYINRLKRQQQRFDFDVKAVGLDAGYFTSARCKQIEDEGVYAVMGYRRPTHKKGYLYKRQYHYNETENTYTCPNNNPLIYKTTDRQGYRHYQSNPTDCKHCPLLSQYTKSMSKPLPDMFGKTAKNRLTNID